MGDTANLPKQPGAKDRLGFFWEDPAEAVVQLTDAFLKQLEQVAQKEEPFKLGGEIEQDEWDNAKASPRPVVEKWFYEDVGVFIAPGGTGKTTLILYQAIHIVLELELFGYRVCHSGAVVILTAEDSRETLIARLRYMAMQMQLSDKQIQTIQEEIIITDVSGSGFKLTTVVRDVVVPHERNVKAFILAASEVHPAIIFIDPAVSFGIGESRVNDAEQGLVDTARRIRNELGCAVMYVHHTGKQNARESTLDQYSGRGGSAFADGARMVHVIQKLDAQEWLAATGDTLQQDEFGFVYARPKISAARPQPKIYLKRMHYTFERFEQSMDADAALTTNADRVWRFLKDEQAEGTPHSKNSLEEKLKGTLTQKAVRAAVERLKLDGRVMDEKMTTTGRGGMRACLRPLDLNGPE